jgi:hypothetical protein
MEALLERRLSNAILASQSGQMLSGIRLFLECNDELVCNPLKLFTGQFWAQLADLIHPLL